jgi:hypothetical protein
VRNDESVASSEVNAYEQMTAMVLSYWVTQTIRAVADLSIADHLAHGSVTAAEIGQRENSAPDATLRLMRAAVSTGLLEADGHGRFRSTALLQTLRSDDPCSIRPLALAVTQPSHWQPWGALSTAVREGKSQAVATLGMTLFDYYQNNPSAGEEFAAYMRSMTALWGDAVAKEIDTTGIRRVVDVGGANGSLLHYLQQANPRLRGIVFDRPNMIGHARAEIMRTGFPDRTDAVGGDFFVSVPPADLYLLKFILHDWNDDECVVILQRCREAMATRGRIAIIEYDVNGQNPIAALSDLNMLALTGGRERSVEEYDALLVAAGLRRTIVRETGTPKIVIEAVATDRFATNA